MQRPHPGLLTNRLPGEVQLQAPGGRGSDRRAPALRGLGGFLTRGQCWSSARRTMPGDTASALRICRASWIALYDSPRSAAAGASFRWGRLLTRLLPRVCTSPARLRHLGHDEDVAPHDRGGRECHRCGRGADVELDMRDDRRVDLRRAGAEAEGGREGREDAGAAHWCSPFRSTPRASRMLRVMGAFPAGPSPLPAGLHATRDARSASAA